LLQALLYLRQVQPNQLIGSELFCLIGVHWIPTTPFLCPIASYQLEAEIHTLYGIVGPIIGLNSV
jgi:hypothetical protein